MIVCGFCSIIQDYVDMAGFLFAIVWDGNVGTSF